MRRSLSTSRSVERSCVQAGPGTIRMTTSGPTRAGGTFNGGGRDATNPPDPDAANRAGRHSTGPPARRPSALAPLRCRKGTFKVAIATTERRYVSTLPTIPPLAPLSIQKPSPGRPRRRSARRPVGPTMCGHEFDREPARLRLAVNEQGGRAGMTSSGDRSRRARDDTGAD